MARVPAMAAATSNWAGLSGWLVISTGVWGGVRYGVGGVQGDTL